MNSDDAIVLAGMLLGIPLCIGSINKFNVLLDRNNLLKNISDDIFIDSASIKKKKEEIKTNLNFTSPDNLIKEHFILLEKNFSNDELVLLKHNLKNLKLEIPIGVCSGKYNPIENKISADPTLLSTFIHELLHLAANLGIINEILVIGFQQFNNNKSIGRGLNESYTEYLSKNILNNKNYSYKKTVDLIPLIEEFYDNKNELRQNYFDADLPSVIKKFEEVYTKEESLNLIRDIDKLWIYDNYKTWFDKSKILELSIRIRLYDYYKKLTGRNDKEELFFDKNMLNKISSKTKLLK